MVRRTSASQLAVSAQSPSSACALSPRHCAAQEDSSHPSHPLAPDLPNRPCALRMLVKALTLTLSVAAHHQSSTLESHLPHLLLLLPCLSQSSLMIARSPSLAPSPDPTLPADAKDLLQPRLLSNSLCTALPSSRTAHLSSHTCPPLVWSCLPPSLPAACQTAAPCLSPILLAAALPTDSVSM